MPRVVIALVAVVAFLVGAPPAAGAAPPSVTVTSVPAPGFDTVRVAGTGFATYSTFTISPCRTGGVTVTALDDAGCDGSVRAVAFTGGEGTFSVQIAYNYVAPTVLAVADESGRVLATAMVRVESPRTCGGETPTMVGTSGPDFILGTNGDDVIVTFGGNDVIESRGGDDIICSGFGNDVIDAGPGDDRVYASAGDDVIAAGDGADVIRSGGGADVADGGMGRDRLWGGLGRDILDGGPNRDAVFGNDDPDEVFGGPGNDRVNGGDGDDLVHGGDGDDIVIGGAGTDACDGGAGTDVTNRTCDQRANLPGAP